MALTAYRIGMNTARQPTDDSHRPQLNKDGFDCPQCGRWAHQIWNGLTYELNRFEQKVVLPGEDRYASGSLRWRISVCSRCEQPAMWRHDQLVYPLSRLAARPHPDMPDDVRSLYDEAAAVAAVSRRAAAALARTTVERLIKHLVGLC